MTLGHSVGVRLCSESVQKYKLQISSNSVKSDFFFSQFFYTIAVLCFLWFYFSEFFSVCQNCVHMCVWSLKTTDCVHFDFQRQLCAQRWIRWIQFDLIFILFLNLNSEKKEKKNLRKNVNFLNCSVCFISIFFISFGFSGTHIGLIVDYWDSGLRFVDHFCVEKKIIKKTNELQQNIERTERENANSRRSTGPGDSVTHTADTICRCHFCHHISIEFSGLYQCKGEFCVFWEKKWQKFWMKRVREIMMYELRTCEKWNSLIYVWCFANEYIEAITQVIAYFL